MSIPFACHRSDAANATGLGDALAAVLAFQSEWASILLRRSDRNFELAADLAASLEHGDHLEVLSDHVMFALAEIPVEATTIAAAGDRMVSTFAAVLRT